MDVENARAPLTERKVVRRGLIAGLAGLGAAAVMKITGTSGAEAANNDPLVLGNVFNSATSLTGLQTTTTRTALSVSKDSAVTALDCAFSAINDTAGPNQKGIFTQVSGSNIGLLAHATQNGGIGAQGVGSGSTGGGVRGVGLQNGPGIRGVSNAANSPTEEGTGSGIGVNGKSGSGAGVQGESQSFYGVSGICFGSSVGVFGGAVNGAGVWGQSNTYVGVYGNSLGNATGVYGVSQGGSGVVGESASGIGVYAVGHTAFVPALFAQSVAGVNQVAARFDGSVVINGNQTVTGAKSAIVPHPDGIMRTLYCQESPEAWFEDFGRAQLVNGIARVQVDPDFIALVQGEYSVFPAPEGNCNGLFVTQKTPAAFEVRETNGGKSSLTFAYRVVAKRKDVPAPRFARVDPRHTARDKVMDLIPGVGLAHIPNRPGPNVPGANRNGP